MVGEYTTKDYERDTGRTDLREDEYADHPAMIAAGIPDQLHYALGLSSEAGEVADLYKKIITGRYYHSADAKSRVLEELGDVLWYVTRLALSLNSSLEEVMRINTTKLEYRYDLTPFHEEGSNEETK